MSHKSEVGVHIAMAAYHLMERLLHLDFSQPFSELYDKPPDLHKLQIAAAIQVERVEEVLHQPAPKYDCNGRFS